MADDKPSEWLRRQIELAVQDMASWPEWMRREARWEGAAPSQIEERTNGG